jgi:hypothetical protein
MTRQPERTSRCCQELRLRSLRSPAVKGAASRLASRGPDPPPLTGSPLRLDGNEGPLTRTSSRHTNTRRADSCHKHFHRQLLDRGLSAPMRKGGRPVCDTRHSHRLVRRCCEHRLRDCTSTLPAAPATRTPGSAAVLPPTSLFPSHATLSVASGIAAMRTAAAITARPRLKRREEASPSSCAPAGARSRGGVMCVTAAPVSWVSRARRQRVAVGWLVAVSARRVRVCRKCLTDMESRLSRGASRISRFRGLAGRGCGRLGGWRSGVLCATRVRLIFAVQLPQDHGSSWGAAV